jgi:hypothetical protein
LGVVAPGGVELVEPIWSCPSSLLSLVARVMACLSRSAAPEEVPGWLCEAMVVVLVWRVEGAVPTLSVERVGTRLLDLLRR